MSEGTLLNAALACGALTAAVGTVAVIRGREKTALGRLLLLLTGIVLAGALGLRWKESGHAPLANQYESMVFLAFCVAPCVLSFRRAQAWVTALAGIAIVLLLGVAALLKGPAEPLMPALQSNWLLIHVAVSMAAYALFLLAGFAAAWLLLRGKIGGPYSGDLDEFGYRTMAVGFFLLALSIITGAVWANEAWGSWWSWDPKETWALITWVFYAVALHLRRVRNWYGRRFAWMSLAGLACVVFTYFGVNYFLSGLHSYAG